MRDDLDAALRASVHELAQTVAVKEPPAAEAAVRVRVRRRARRRRATRLALVGVVGAVAVVLVGVTVQAGRGGDDRVATAPVTDRVPDAPEQSAAVSGHQLGSGHWERSAPSPRAIAADVVVAWTGKELLTWGGQDGDGLLTAGLAYEPGSDTWRGLGAAPGPGRLWPVTAWTGRRWLVVGGYDGGAPRRDGIAYDPVTDTWSSIPDAPFAPVSGTWTGSEVVVVDDSGVRVAAYDPAVGAWRDLPDVPDTGLRYGRTAAVWADDALSLWRTGTSMEGGGLGTRSVGYRLDGGGWRSLGGGQRANPVEIYAAPGGLVARSGSLCPVAASCPIDVRARALSFDGGVWVEHESREMSVSDRVSAWTGRALVLAGCCDDTGPAAWDRSDGTWTRLPVPPEQGRQALVWTGSRLLLVGVAGVQVLTPATADGT